MKFAMMFANIGGFSEPDVADGMGPLAEECGFESLWTVEHVVVPKGYVSEYPYDQSGRMPAPEDMALPDPLVWLTWIGANTTKLRLGTGILILPQRNPVVLAKETATLDRLTKGRLMLGVGAGWLEEEFNALDIPFADRGPRTDDYIGALRALWTESPASYDGKFASFTDCYSEPKPAQRGGIPIVIGGHSLPAARRAGRLGDGFFPGRGTAAELAPLLDAMRAAATEADRDPDAIEVTAMGPLDVDGVKAFEALGVHRIAVPPLGFDLDTLKTSLASFHDTVISKF